MADKQPAAASVWGIRDEREWPPRGASMTSEDYAARRKMRTFLRENAERFGWTQAESA